MSDLASSFRRFPLIGFSILSKMKAMSNSKDFFANFSSSRNKNARRGSKVNDKSSSKDRIGTQRSFGSTFRIANKNSNQMNYSRDRKSRQNLNNSQVTHKYMNKIYECSTNRKSPKYAANSSKDNIIFTPNKHSQMKNSSKVMKKHFEQTKGYRGSRNLEMTRRMKNSTQLVAITSSSRNTSSNIALSNASVTSRIKNPSKGSISSNLFCNRSKTKDLNNKQQNLRNCTRNRRTELFGRNSVEEIKSFKSNITNKSFEDKGSNLRQTACKSTLNIFV